MDVKKTLASIASMHHRCSGMFFLSEPYVIEFLRATKEKGVSFFNTGI